MKDRDVCWVEFEPETTRDDAVASAYASVREKDGHVHNLYKAMSLAPRAIGSADALYRELMHGEDCPLQPWLRELIAVQVAIIDGCEYATAHHAANFHDLYGDAEVSKRLLARVHAQDWDSGEIDVRLAAILRFNDKLARASCGMEEHDVEALRVVGLSDKEIVYVSQISAAFAYWTRTINALGISLRGEPVGLAKHPPV